MLYFLVALNAGFVGFCLGNIFQIYIRKNYP